MASGVKGISGEDKDEGKVEDDLVGVHEDEDMEGRGG